MTQNAGDIPWWVDLIAPAITVFTLANGAVVWIARKIFLDFLGEELQKKHKENQEVLAENKRAIEDLKKEIHWLRDELEVVRMERYRVAIRLRPDAEGQEGG